MPQTERTYAPPPQSHYMDLQRFVESGLLQEANRLFFHPRGLALVVAVDKTPEGVRNHRLTGIADYRHCPEGIYFTEFTESDVTRGQLIEAERVGREPGRIETLGFAVQPLEVCNHRERETPKPETEHTGKGQP